MRRTTAAVIGTIAGTALLVGVRLGANPATGASVEDAAPPQALAPAAGSGAGAEPGTGTSAAPKPGRAKPSPSPSPSKRKKRTTTPKPADPGAGSGSGSGSNAGSGSGSGGGSRSGTFRGGAASNKYGTWVVTVTVSGGKLTDVRTSYPTSPSKTLSINERAIPRLQQQAVQAQSANVSSISGATYTYTAFRASLRSALTQAGL